MNSLGTNCPTCAKDIGTWSIIRGPWPNIGLRCPHCKAALKYSPVPWGLIALLFVFYLLLLFVARAAIVAALGVKLTAAVVFLVACVVLWQPFELLVAHRLRARATLFLK
jgi:hypothetical protein